ncbi:PIN domain-containing protein [Azospirillum melinis]|uniref:PIN domain-containing protein n=1 Tax=Azospirillum melinis TaxID=328839 RepID=A0ABX2KL55_9PROT|nr:PIN domain-containing protein [Azospirillum melinis]MBP2306168.1 putative nucleic acid-binding protein [Azospirillum melinis]NUB03441.1 PIN domain-containing protein [Azospirillum melinis]
MKLAGIDTNVLLYAVDSAGDPEKHRRAVYLLDRLGAGGCGVLPLQTLTEFYSVAVRKYRASPEQASRYVDVWSAVFPIREAVFADVVDAMRIHRDHGVQFWDGMIWSVIRRAGGRVLFSEDLQDGRELEGVRFMNPFASANASVLEELLTF